MLVEDGFDVLRNNIKKKKEKKERIRRYRILGSMNFVDIEVDNALL